MIVDRLKRLRITNKISQKAFAQALNVSQQTVASWEVGRTEPSNVALIEIANYFEVTTDYLLGRDSKLSSLTKIQKALLEGFNVLNNEGQNLMMSVLGSLLVSHAKQNQLSAGVVQSNQNGNNYYGISGGNFNSTVTVG